MLQLQQMLLKLAFYVYENGRLTAEAEADSEKQGGEERERWRGGGGGAVVLEYSLGAAA